jgi:hypothetical protein
MQLTIPYVHVPPHRMADVAYNTSSFPALLRTLVSLLALSNSARSIHGDDQSDGVQDTNDDAGGDGGPGSGSSRRARETRKADRDYEERGCVSGQWHDSGPLMLLAYKERDSAERQLWDMMARETDIVLECVGKQAGAGGLPVEIWLGKRRSSRRGR